MLKKTSNKNTETNPWYETLRTSYWYDNEDHDLTTWYISEIERPDDLDDLLDEWSITTRTSTTTPTTTTK